MNEDISKNTLLVLVVLTIVVSLLGTWTVISESSKIRAEAPAPAAGEQQVGKVSLDIAPPRAPISATGQVMLTIVNT